MQCQRGAICRSKEAPVRSTPLDRGRVNSSGLRRLAQGLVGVAVGVLGSAPMPAHAFGERIHHAAANAPHPVRRNVQQAKADIRGYVNDRQCGKSGVINGAERFLANQKDNLKTAKAVGNGIKRASRPLDDAVSKVAQGAATAAALARKYPGAVTPVVGAIRNYHQAMKKYRQDQRKTEYVFTVELAAPLVEEVGGAYFCGKSIIGWVAGAGEVAAAEATAGLSAARAVEKAPKETAETVFGCTFTVEHVLDLPKDIDSAKEFLELLRQSEEDQRKVSEQHDIVDKAIVAAGKKIPPAGRGQLENLRTSMKAAAQDAARSHAIMQSSVSPQLKEALHRTTLHLQSGVTTVATCAKKLHALSNHLKQDLKAGL